MSNSLHSINPSSTRSRGKETRESLVLSALEIFGRNGFEAASTRDIADKAGANQALINYHFKGKQGLYLAVFEHIAHQMSNGVGALATEILNELEDARILFGQVHILKVSRATVLAHMQWEEFELKQMNIAEKLIFSNINSFMKKDFKEA